MIRKGLSRFRRPSALKGINSENLSASDRRVVLHRFRKAHEDRNKRDVLLLRPYIVGIVVDPEASEEEIGELVEGLLDLHDTGEPAIDVEDMVASYSQIGAGLLVDWILTDALEHPNCPVRLISRAARSRSGRLRYAAISNPNCPDEHMVEAALQDFPSHTIRKW